VGARVLPACLPTSHPPTPAPFLRPLQDPGTAGAVRDAMARPEGYVLKPQREGGGNNLYGDALAQRLSCTDDLAAFILMQRILPPVNKWVGRARVCVRARMRRVWGGFCACMSVGNSKRGLGGIVNVARR
jgi:hypothetical protein